MKKGLTLVEVVISTAIAVVVGVLLVTIIVNTAGIYTKESSKLSEGLNINDALSQIRSNIKDAGSVVASYTGDSTTYTTGATQLILKISSIDSSNNIISNTFDYFVYFQDSNKLRFKTFPDPASARKKSDRIFTTSLDNLLFQYFNSSTPPVEVLPAGAAKIRISLTLKQKNGASYEINTATSEGSLRND